MPRLVNVGGFFQQETGASFSILSASDFNLYGRYLKEGEAAVRPVFKDRHAIGFNCRRVWLAYWGGNDPTTEIPGIGNLNPADFPDFYQRLKPFCALASQYGAYLEFTAFTGAHIPGHWEAIGDGLQGVTNVLVELCNENNAHPLRIDPNAYQKLPGVLCSHGSNASQVVPPRPAWDYEVLHHVNVYQWPRKVGHNTMELTFGTEGIPASQVPAVGDENTRPDQDGNLNHFYDAAAAATLLCAGSTFHCQCGKASIVYDDRDRHAAEAWVSGALSIPLHCQPGPYKHRSDLEGPDAGDTGERVYQRGTEDVCIAYVRPW